MTLVIFFHKFYLDLVFYKPRLSLPFLHYHRTWQKMEPLNTKILLHLRHLKAMAKPAAGKPKLLCIFAC